MTENETLKGTGKTILVVDDDIDYLYQQRVELEAAGYTVLEAQSGNDAEKVLDKVHPNLVVVDLMMEEEDRGFSLCYSIKKRYPDVPVIMVTGVASETGISFDASTHEERRWVKADALLNKPIRFEQLIREIQRLLKE